MNEADLDNIAARLGWRKDDDTMTMIEKRCILALQVAQDVLTGKQPLLPGLIRTFIELCSLLNIERHGDHREAATRLLHKMDATRSTLRRIWDYPRTEEIQQQLALVEPIYNRVNLRLNGQWPEVRSQSDAEECKQLGHTLRLRKKQLAEVADRYSIQAEAV